MYIGYYYKLPKQQGWQRTLTRYQGINIVDDRADKFDFIDSRIFLEVLHGREIFVRNLLKDLSPTIQPMFIADFIWEAFYKERANYQKEEFDTQLFNVGDAIKDERITPKNPITSIRKKFLKTTRNADLAKLIGLSACTISYVERGITRTLSPHTANRLAPFLKKDPEVIAKCYACWRRNNIGDVPPSELKKAIMGNHSKASK